jgi:hypothetical protein
MDSITRADNSDFAVTHSRPNAEAFLSIHRYLPVASFYFFLNRAGLPLGLFYTSIFAPLLYFWLYLEGRRWLTAKFLLALSPFIVAHMIDGVASPMQYLRSLFLLWTVYIAVYAFCWALMRSRTIERLLEQLIVLNFFVAILALIVRPTPLWPLLWSDSGQIIEGTQHLLRMNLQSTTEPWAYGELMLPLIVFAAYRVIQKASPRNILYLAMIVFPFLLCQSFGGISLCLAAIVVMIIADIRKLLLRAQFWILILCSAMAAVPLLIIPNPISARVWLVLVGGDASTQLRVFFAYPAAWAIATSKSLWWGVGLGQMKLLNLAILGHGIETTLPNAASQTLAEWGLIGLLSRFAVELYLFFRTRTYSNSFRFAMFVVAFFSQLTGSYNDDVQSYLLWLFAFCPILTDENSGPIKSNWKTIQ